MERLILLSSTGRIQGHVWSMLVLVLILLLESAIPQCQAFNVVPFAFSSSSSFSPLRGIHDNDQQAPTFPSGLYGHYGISKTLLWMTPPSGSMASSGSKGSSSSSVVSDKFQVDEEVGSGSYGTVHLIQAVENDEVWRIGKRPWSVKDLEQLQQEEEESPRDKKGNNNNNLSKSSKSNIPDRAQRCRVYWETERYCFQKLLQSSNDMKGLPRFQNTIRDDDDGHEWMLFDLVTTETTSDDDDEAEEDTPQPALSLQDWMEMDRLDHKQHGSHHLFLLSQALGVSSKDLQEQQQSTVHEDDDDVQELEFWASMMEEDGDDGPMLAATLDKVMLDLLEILEMVHSNAIVHRDIKPSNILVTKGQLYLIDFGSAADLDTAGPLRKNIGLSERVAISPIYAAPEVFVDASVKSSALKFDCFSLALLYCQLLFQYLDERTDAGFHQQLQAANWNLDAWLATEMSGTIRPAGLDSALRVLSLRPGLWTLLQAMLKPDPWDRVDSKTALARYRSIVKESQNLVEGDVVDSSVIAASDGAFLADVLESMDFCIMPDDDWPSLTVRPLQFVATFRRKESLGLILAEAVSVDAKTDFDDEDDPETARQLWRSATSSAVEGEVFVKGVVKGGQADEMGIFHVGDRLQGVGELPLANQGFDGAVRLLQEETTPDPNYITLHFDRQSYSDATTDYREEGEQTLTPMSTDSVLERPIRVSDQGAWSSCGRRKSQEDRYLLHELHDDNDERSILVAGVFDGHLGVAAAAAAQAEFPRIMSQEKLASPQERVEDMMEVTWQSVCDMYRSQCGSSMDDSCRVADYDAREGTLDANTGASDAVAGTTANVVALDKQTGRLAFLNCGDSRSFAASEKGVIFKTVDHKPEREMDRFRQAQDDPACLYEMPQCRFSRWYVPVGDYEYAVSRSLEGPFATARGVVSDADIEVVNAEPGTTIVCATDGLWEVCDTDEVCKSIQAMRFQHGMSASDMAKVLCSRAIEKGSTDNVSVVILVLDE